ncbi:MAG: c-type cytochrome, partial [Anaerolineales bacterium]|nr:c-type cytochrome [Anaerolineales bacterium]
MTRFTRIALGLALAGLFLAACSLAGDVTPPPGARTIVNAPAELPTQPPVTSAPVQPSAGTEAPVALAPSGRPSAAEGAALFAEHCAPCHGDTGNGDGPMAANVPGGSAAVPKFALPDLARQASPQTWFGVVTQGRLDKFMPPFNEKLSDTQRWNVVAFVYTLSTPPDQIAAGQAAYDANCANCHGADGQGQGPDAAGAALRDFTDSTLAAAFSPAQLFDAITTGAGVADHAFTSALSEDQRWATVAYLRAFAYDYFAPGSPL